MHSSDPEEQARRLLDGLEEHERERQDSPPPPPEAPVPTLARYELREKLGEGAMATVYRAIDRNLGRPVALKFLKHELGLHEQARKRFQREAQAAARLSHPNVVALHDSGDADGRLYLVLELVEGRPLADALEKDRLSLRSKVEILEQAARGVAAAHAAGIIHRDLKPGNILLTRENVPKVADFGLAHLAGSEAKLTRTGAALGTPLYMAPEQVAGSLREITVRTDVYALGAILYEMLAGRPPHLGESPAAVYAKIVGSDPENPSKSNAGVPRDLEAVCLRALDREPARRYPTADAFADDLARWLAGEPVQAKRTSRSYRLYRTVKRYPLATGLAATAALAFTAALIALASIRDERDRQAKREAALKQLATMWATIIDRKRDLRSVKMAPSTAWQELSAAVHAVDGYVAARPDEPQGYYVRARGLLYLDDTEGAEKDVRTAVGKRPDFRPGWALLGMVRMEVWQDQIYADSTILKERHEEAAPALREAVEAFARGWEPGREREEAERWGLPWTREDQVMERVARALQLRFLDRNSAEAQRLLKAGFDEYQAEEYAAWLALCAVSPREAAESLDKAIAIAPGYEKAFRDRGSARLQRGDVAGALADYDRAVDLRKDNARAYFGRGLVRDAQENHAEAIADYTRAIAIRPHYIEAHVNRGLARRRQGDLPGAIADLTRAIEVKVDFGKAWSARGDVRLMQGDAKGAVEDLDRSIKIDPQRAPSYFRRGNAKRTLGDLAGAMADYDRTIEMKRDYAEAYNNRGIVRKAMGNLQEAVADYDRAIEHKRDYAEAYYNRGSAKLALGRTAEAIVDYDLAIACRKGYANAYLGRGNSKRALGDLPGAIADYDRAIELGGDLAFAHYGRGATKQDQGRNSEAIADLTRAIEINPAYGEAFNARGFARQALRDFPGALADYDRAIGINRNHASAWGNRGTAKEALGRVAEAIEDYETALRIAPPDWPYRARIERQLAAARGQTQ